jgi:hypothetical protein
MAPKLSKTAKKKPGTRAGGVILCSYGLYPEQITFETLEELRRADVVFMDFPIPRLQAWLGRRPRIISAAPGTGLNAAALLTRAGEIAALARRGERVAVISYGNPKFVSVFSELLAGECARGKVSLRTLSAVSSFDALITALPPFSFDQNALRLVCPDLSSGRLLEHEAGNLIFNLQSLGGPSIHRESLLRAMGAYPAGHPVALVRCRAEGAQETVKWLTAGNFGDALKMEGLERYTIYVPPLPQAGKKTKRHS